MGIVVILAFALRVNLLDGQSLRGDEAASATYATFPAAKIVAISHTIDPHPPTFYLLLHWWEQLAGVSAFAVRLWVVFPAVLSVAVLFALVSRMIDRRTGVVSAFLLAVNSYHIWHSQDLRSYTWLLLWGLLASLALWRALHHPHPKSWGWYTAALLGMVYLHYYAVFVIGFQLLFAAYFWVRQKNARRAIVWGMGASLAVATVAFLPWVIFSWQFVSGFTGDFAAASPVEVFWRGLNAFAGGLIAAPPRFSGWAAAAVGLAAAGMAGFWRTRRDAVLFFALYWLTTVAGIGVLSVRGQAFTERYLFAALPGFIALTAMGTVWLWRRRFRWERGLAVLAMVIVLGQNGTALWRYWFDPALAKAPQWRQVFDFVAARQKPGTDVLLYNFPDAAITYYADTRRLTDKIPAVLVPFAANEPPEAVDAELLNLLAEYRRVWFVPVSARGWDDARAVQTWLMRHAVRLDGVSAHWATADLYLTPSAALAEMTPQPVRFENGIRLLGFRVENDGAISAAHPLKITLVWQADRPVAEPLTVFVQLIDRTGFRRGGRDNPPVQGTYPVTEWQPGETVMDGYAIAPDAGAPPGVYRLWVGWYNPQTGARVSVIGGEDHIVLSASVRVQ